MMIHREQVETEILCVVDALANVELGGDAAFLRDLLAEDFVCIGPRGFMLNKEQWLARYASGDLKYESFTWDTTLVRVYGATTAVVTGVETSQGTFQGRQIQGQFRATLVFVWHNERWLMVNLQLSPLAEKS